MICARLMIVTWPEPMIANSVKKVMREIDSDT